MDIPFGLDRAVSHGFFGQLTEDEQLALQAASSRRLYPSHMPLLYQGDEANSILVLISGWAAVTTSTEDGNDVMLAVAGPGDILGEATALHNQPRVATVTALTDVHALLVSPTRFMVFLDQHPRVWRVLHQIAARRLDRAYRRARAHATVDGARRLALLLVDLVEQELSPPQDPPRLGALRLPDLTRLARSIGITETAGMSRTQLIAAVQDKGGGRLPQFTATQAENVQLPPLTQAQMGSWVGVSRLTVARALQTWREQGLVRTGHRKITITDLAGLKAFAQGRPTTRGASQVRPKSVMAAAARAQARRISIVIRIDP